MASNNDRRFYVYAVRINGRTRYVGKGCGDRYKVHLTRSHNTLLACEVAAARAQGRKVRVRIVKGALTESEAFALERRMIAKWADRLTNVSEGGYTVAERIIGSIRSDLATMKSAEQIRREGAWMGASVDERLSIRSQCIDSLHRLEALAARI